MLSMRRSRRSCEEKVTGSVGGGEKEEERLDSVPPSPYLTLP